MIYFRFFGVKPTPMYHYDLEMLYGGIDLVDIGSSNDGTMPLPEPMLTTQHMCPVAFLNKCSGILSVTCVWMYTFKITTTSARGHKVNSSRPTNAFMRQQTKSQLVYLMTCRLFGTEHLSETMNIWCQLNPKKHILMTF